MQPSESGVKNDGFVAAPDNDLVRAAVSARTSGDAALFEKAFTALVHRHDRRVLALALTYTGSRDDAKDIYQEVFLRAHRSLESFEFKSEFSTWLHRITVNVCLSHRSEAKRRATVSLDAMETQPVSSGAVFKETESQTESHPAAQAGLGLELQAALDLLSPQQRIVFTLKHSEGYKISEIAAMLGTAEGTVKKHLFTAIERLRVTLKDRKFR